MTRLAVVLAAVWPCTVLAQSCAEAGVMASTTSTFRGTATGLTYAC